MRILLLLVFSIIGVHASAFGQPDTTVYKLSISNVMVNKTGKSQMAMAINGSIPGPILRFKEGDYAVIYVTNTMSVETSLHWHGLLLPNFYDGVPYLTTPPIQPGKTQKYEFPLIQSGTYWYHSHTMLQEQSGLFGSIVIEPKEKTLDYDKELVLVLSDWTNEKPKNVLRNLKRGNEWYGVKKGTSTPLNKVIARKGLGAQMNFWKQRMEGADIADIYYPAFLSNGERTKDYPEFKAGEKVRLRIINGSASSQFWMTFGGADPLLVSSDGIDVVPVRRNKTFIAIAETYDFIVDIPENGKVEFRATAQDGSGQTSIYLGQGDVIAAPEVMRPDKIRMMKSMAKMDMKMGAPAMKSRPGVEEPQKMKTEWGMKMDDSKMEMDHSKKDHSEMGHDMDMSKEADKKLSKDDSKMEMEHAKMNHSEMGHDMDMSKKMEKNMPESNSKMKMDHSKINHMKSGMDHEGMDMSMYDDYTYDYLKSPTPTTYDANKPVKEILLNLTGNMWRYIWSLNGVPLSEADLIKIEKGEVVRITLNNLTMMHHPMHLHGHFFRVLNANGDYSPLKHTVNVPPMQEVSIEFDASEDGDWFFHCHVLYHMMSGMARVYSYDTPRDSRLAPNSLEKVLKEGSHYYQWGTLDLTSHMTELNLVSSNIRNQWNLGLEYGWNQNMEAELSYERYVSDYFRVFVGVNAENEIENSLDEISTTAVAGIRYFTPYMFNLDLRLDNKLRPEIRLSREIMIFPRTSIFGNYEYKADLGLVNELSNEMGQKKSFLGETTWSVGLDYLISRNFSATASYDNRFGAGAGLMVRF
ncbi:multicopper oxidase domain-containing protein [Arcticibacterium luteifluviistationis]|uniref:Copper oxidase n=1 Tax=Arcticibacterium luteifluviistationis TaxID=1784714 RepID=A0A2Z4G7A3_9BACT|nr:multicopper oxidase domain-containing protein [Arcticibacterium luteifluviistationis]AWV97062.1 copper oxidase [Arcticibacterium luteifluviistationis]